MEVEEVVRSTVLSLEERKLLPRERGREGREVSAEWCTEVPLLEPWPGEEEWRSRWRRSVEEWMVMGRSGSHLHRRSCRSSAGSGGSSGPWRCLEEQEGRVEVQS